MSYVVTSNPFNDVRISTSERESAFSYHNSTSDTYEILPNSEIAVASVKINKSNKVTLTKGMRFYNYMGVYITDALSNQGKTTTIPHQAELLSDITGMSEYEEVDLNTLAKRVATALNESVFNTELYGLFNVNVKYDAADNSFKGLQIESSQRISAKVTPRDTLSATTTFDNLYQTLIDDGDIDATAGLTYDNTDNSLVAQNQPDKWANVATCLQNPIGTSGGLFSVDLTNMTGTNWGVGLSRSDAGDFCPPSFSVPDSEIAMYQMHFYDYVVMGTQSATATDRRLRLYHCVKSRSSDTAGSPVITMREIQYFNNKDSALVNEAAGGTAYNWSTNGANKKISKIMFEIENERVIISFIDDAGAKSLICSSKVQYPKPISDCCRTLYPRVFVQNHSKKMLIDEIGGLSDNNDFKAYHNPKYDWYAWLMNSGTYFTNGGGEMDIRFFNDMDNTEQYVAKGLTDVGANQTLFTLTDYKNVFVVAPDSKHYLPSGGANMANILGFPNRQVVDFAGSANAGVVPAGRGLLWVSIDPSVMLGSLGSLFVRLNQLNIRTLNAGKGQRSMVMYHLPRFDASGNSDGVGLFYEPSQRIYIKLRNTEAIRVNDWWVDIVNEDETLARSLTGKTIVTFHIRDSDTKRES